MSETKTTSGGRWVRPVIGVIIIAVIATGLGRLRGGAGQGDADKVPEFVTRQGPMTVSVTESGTIQPREQLIIKNELEGKTTLLYLIPEGTVVSQGVLLVELDATALIDNSVDLEILVQNAEAGFIQARENLAVVSNAAASELDKAILDLRFADEDLAQYIEGEYPNALREQEARVILAEEEFHRAGETLKWSQALSDGKYISDSELQTDLLAVKKAALDVGLASNSLALLKDYTYKRSIAELESDLKQNTMGLERTRRKASADVVQAEANLRAKASEFERKRDKHEKLMSQISKAKIFAPRAGLVVYVSSTKGSWRRSNQEPLAEGQAVRERQELIFLPTASTFLVELKLHESNLDKIKVGLPVRIRVGALPGARFSGVVASIAPLADAQSSWMNPDLKVYSTEVHIENTSDALRTGMSCEAEVLIAHYPSAVYVPVQSVVRANGEPTVYVSEMGAYVARPVDIGFDNGRMVHVLNGLQEGEIVSLAPPLAEGAVGEEDALTEDDSRRLDAVGMSNGSGTANHDATQPRKPKRGGAGEGGGH
ncbi:MAG: efflux RND transporter periplasmic adaptor subunit [Kiritimatiellae bacterium]|nr:efflux RND transporter periplasmic adaptor subunit [Kiritimatiellia bacterium]